MDKNASDVDDDDHYQGEEDMMKLLGKNQIKEGIEDLAESY